MSICPPEGVPGTCRERTFIAIKPDGVQRRKIGDIIERFENKGFKLVAMKMCWPSAEKAAAHYDDLKAKKFFGGLVKYFSSGAIVGMVWEGLGAIKTGRVLLGATNPSDSAPGTIRGDLCIHVGRNICHGSDSPEAAKHEINMWFTSGEIATYNADVSAWVYEQPEQTTTAEGLVEAKEEKNGGAAPTLAIHGEAGSNTERTFIAVKPDGVQRGKIGNIIARFENRGFKLVAMRLEKPTEAKAAGHYDDLKSKGFFKGLCKYFSSGPVCAMVWEGKGVIATGRVLLGATNPKDALPGTIRGDLCIDIGRNVCHGSDAPGSAAHEVGFWFKQYQICEWQDCSAQWIYE